ncbi:MAG: hypothetical protein LBV52_05330, partial [Spirochaetaceae bacterium]|nr:hypothetical protein [Spirochaetaceae bacterium]
MNNLKIKHVGEIISKLRSLLSKKQKAYLLVLFFLTLVLSLIETIGVSIIMPFITVASNPGVLERGRYHIIFSFLGFTSEYKFIIVFGIGIIVFYVLRSVYNVVYTYILNRFALGTYTNLAKRIYLKYLAMPYKKYLAKNSSDLHLGITEANRVSGLLLSILQICSDFIILFMLYSFMIIVNWQMTIILTVLLV